LVFFVAKGLAWLAIAAAGYATLTDWLIAARGVKRTATTKKTVIKRFIKPPD